VTRDEVIEKVKTAFGHWISEFACNDKERAEMNAECDEVVAWIKVNCKE